MRDGTDTALVLVASSEHPRTFRSPKMNAEILSLTPAEIVAQCLRLDALFDEVYALRIDLEKKAQLLSPLASIPAPRPTLP